MESALVEHEAVAEAAVVSHPHPVKGESLYCFVTLKDGCEYSAALEAELKKKGTRFSLALYRHGDGPRPIDARGFICVVRLTSLSDSAGEDRRHRHAGLHAECSSAPKNKIR